MKTKAELIELITNAVENAAIAAATEAMLENTRTAAEISARIHCSVEVSEEFRNACLHYAAGVVADNVVDDLEWPKELPADGEYRVTMYQEKVISAEDRVACRGVLMKGHEVVCGFNDESEQFSGDDPIAALIMELVSNSVHEGCEMVPLDGSKNDVWIPCTCGAFN